MQSTTPSLQTSRLNRSLGVMLANLVANATRLADFRVDVLNVSRMLSGDAWATVVGFRNVVEMQCATLVTVLRTPYELNFFYCKNPNSFAGTV